MCGRYSLHGPHSRLRRQFGVDDDLEYDSYNIAPGSRIPVIRPGRRLELVRWGLRAGGRVANVRDDSTVKPWARSLLRERVVLPMSGFYEWQAPKEPRGRKQPYYMTPMSSDYLAVAGAIARWDDRGATLFTSAPNDLLAPIHDRMPVLLDAEGVELWLDPDTPIARVLELLRPAPDGALRMWPVGIAVNRVTPETDGPALIEPCPA